MSADVITVTIPNRRRDESGATPVEPLTWPAAVTAEQIIAAAADFVATRKLADVILAIPMTSPQRYLAIGTASDIGGLLAEPVDTMRAELEQLRADNAALRDAGGRMANALHNLAQTQPNAPWQASHVPMLDGLRRDWNTAAKLT